MSDYGQGPAPRPWHPDDPLYGDPYGSYDGTYASHDPYADGAPQYPQQAPQQQYGPQQYGPQQYGPQQYGQYPQQPHIPQQPQWDTQPQPQVQAYGGWETAQAGQAGYVTPPADPYGSPAHPYRPSGYAPQPAPGQTAEWHAPVDEPGPFDEPDEPETHPFFTDAPGSDDYDDDPDGKRPGKKKRRSGCAVLLAFVVLGGVIGGGGYVGYRYYENHIAAAPDYVGGGMGSVTVDVPNGATLAQIGNILKQNGVVKSVEAFTAAAAGTSIQGGSYTLHRQMSAASAVALMTNGSAQNALVIPEGWRATQVYAALDTYLGLAPGTSAAAAKSANLGLPSYAGGNPEGFLYPSRYSIGKSTKPADALTQMVSQAQSEFASDNLQAQAQAVGKSPYEIIVIASLIQAEAQQPQDFGKVSRVIYNRLQQQMALGFDSTINYAKGRSTLHTTTADTQYPSPYNTYLHKGLPPGPIDNPGHQAIEAALNPTAGNWLYFVTVKPGDTRFTDSAAVQQQNVEAFNQYQQEHGGQ
ncbi:endolytic transglycosylase MltG [Streptomyces sp. RB6PN25]|uniref:Endolytic murein transglycosylase n=1 Tax=Streptomyces humicola TaxID=2953240 RepID=A0ABT1PYN4_9ACTN|nr:endolytic transglycosylase MltG [Streptomyces humicola]MCQ4082776.1 endolytic transglycosylase MltG [Streptomyces humicola]